MEIFKLFGTILVDSSKAQESISKTNDKAESLGSKLGSGIKTAGKWGLAIGAAAAAAGGAMLGMATKAAEATDTIDKMSQKIGISRQSYQEWDFILSQNGTSIDKMQAGMKTLVSRMDEAVQGTGEGAEAFKKLQLDAIDPLTGSMKSQEQMFEETVKKLQEMPDGAEKAGLAFDLFGKAGTELMPLLNGTGGSVEELKQKAQELGLVLSDESIDAGVQFTDTMDQLKRSLGSVATNVGVGLMPAILALSESIQEHMPEIQSVIQSVFDAIKLVIGGLVTFWKENGETITSVTKKLFEVLKEVIQIGMDVLKGVIDVVMGLLSGDWERVWTGLKDILQGAFGLIKIALKLALESLVGIVKGIGGLLYSAGESIFKSLWDGIKNIWEGISTWVSDKVTWIADKVTFWKTSKQKMDDNGEDQKDGSHAAGLAFVPFDGYKAELHRGERVITADDNKDYGSNLPIGNYNFTFNSPKSMTPVEAARQSKKAMRAMRLGF